MSSSNRAKEVIKDVIGSGPSRKPKLWALLVGISTYNHTPWNLEYAHADAEALHAHLIDPRGGGYPENQIVKLTNHEATYAAIRDGLTTFLQKPAADDFVIVFFSCHGGPDPQRPSNLYLYPHDTDPKRVAATAVPMRHVEEALSRSNLLSERVVLLVDACHAGALGPSGPKATVDAADAMNQFFGAMASARPGMATLTAAARGEAAWEGKEWGGGHGVFTHFLLEGLRGGAARPEDGIVTVGDLFDYVVGQVKAATADRPQHPNSIVDLNARQWPMAAVSDLIASERYQLGRALYGVGQRLGDRGRFAQAIAEHTDAIHQARQLGRGLPEAHYEIARCQLAMGDYEAGAAALRDALREALDDGGEGRMVDETLLADIHFWSWAAAFQVRDSTATANAASSFAEAHALDPRVVLVRTAGAPRSLRRHALLIGINDCKHPSLSLEGAVNDVCDLRSVLGLQGYAPDDITVLDRADTTTRARIIAELEALRVRTAGYDEVVVFLAARSLYEPTSGVEPQVKIIPSDYEQTAATSILSQDLHHMLVDLTAQHVVVLLDVCHGGGLIEYARAERSYTLLSGSHLHELGEERRSGGLTRGAFSAALARVLRRPTQRSVPAKAVVRAVSQAIASSTQRPVFIGDADLPLFVDTDSSGLERALGQLQRGYLGDQSLSELQAFVEQLMPVARTTLPELSLSIGRRCLDLRAHELAARLFLDASEAQAECFAAQLGLAAAQAHLQDYDAAATAFEEAASSPADPVALECGGIALRRLQRERLGRALLVGVSRGIAHGARQDVREMRRALEQLCRDTLVIEELVEEQATATQIEASFRLLVERSREAPCLFFFSGPGTYQSEPGLVSFTNSYRERVVLISKLAEIAGHDAKNLVCVLDAGWAPSVRMPWSTYDASRFDGETKRGRTDPAAWVSPLATRSASHVTPDVVGHRDVIFLDTGFGQRRAARASAVAHLKIGGVTIYNASILARTAPQDAEPGENTVEAVLPSPTEPGATAVQGVLTHTLVKSLLASSSEKRSTYQGILQFIAREMKWLQPVFVGAAADERFLSNVILEDGFERAVRRVSLDKPIFDTIELLRLRIARLDGLEQGARRREQESIAYRELGIAYVCAGELDLALTVLGQALRASDRKDPEIHAYLGRVLVEQGRDLDAAISHLQQAMELSPSGRQPAHLSYYCGKALHDRMENRRREDTTRLATAWREYLDEGAPLGHRTEVEAYLHKIDLS